MSAHRGDVLSYTHCLSHCTEVSQGLSLPCTSQDPSRLTPSVQRIPEIIKQVIQIPPDSWQSVLCQSYGQCMSKGRGPRQAVRLTERRATDQRAILVTTSTQPVSGLLCGKLPKHFESSFLISHSTPQNQFLCSETTQTKNHDLHVHCKHIDLCSVVTANT